MGSLVWRHGLAGWTRAGEVPEVERKLSPFVATPAATPSEPRPASSSGAHAAARAPAREERAARSAPRYEEETRRAATSSATLYVVSSAAGVVVLGFLAFLFWPRPERKLVSPSDAGLVMLKDGSEATPARAAALPRPPPPAFRAAPATRRVGSGGHARHQRRRRGWAIRSRTSRRERSRSSEASPPGTATSLVFTLYNGSSWRVTELFVKPSRLINDQFVDDTSPRKLVPLQGEQAEPGVDSLMAKVAPDRKKPGVNPFDTGRFQGEAGPRPEAYRCPIVGARGYPPRPGG